MKKVLSAVFVFILLSGAVAFWTLHQLEKSVRSEIIARVSEKTGQEMTIGGEVKTGFSFSPTVRIGDMMIPASCGAEKVCTLRIGLLTAELKLLPLLSRKAELKRLTMTNVDFEIDRGENRIFLAHSDTAEAVVNQKQITVRAQGVADEKTFALAGEVEETAANDYRFSVAANGADFSVEASGNVSSVFANAHGRGDLSLTLKDASLLNPRFPALKNIVINAKTQFDQNKFSVPGFEINAGTAQTASMTAKGAINAFSPLSARFHAELNAPDMGAVAGLPAMPNTTFSADVELKDGFVLENMEMTVGGSDLSGHVVRQTGKDIRVDVFLHSDRLRLADVGGAILYPMAAVLPFSEKQKGKLFSAEPFPVEKLKAAVIDMDIATNHFVGADGTDLGKTELKARMRNGVFSLPDFKLADYVRGQVLFDTSKMPADLKIALKAKDLPLSLFYARDGVDRGSVSGSLQLTGKGDSEAGIAASLNGRAMMNMRDLYIKAGRVSFLPKELSFLFPADENQPLELQCAVINIPVQNGLVSSRKNVALESNVVNLQLSGDVNLKNETLKLKLGISPHSDSVLQSMLNSADISGTLVRPEIALNKEEMLDKALSVGMAFFMGGREAARKTVRQEKLKNVCVTALAEGR